MEDQTIRRTYLLFAGMLEYPEAGLQAQVEECLALLAPVCPEASSRLVRFRFFVQETPSDNLEETYTSTFDLQVLCYPYVGYQIFGESYKRGAFMVGLKEQYRAYGHSEGKELPDHLAVVLRFMAVNQDLVMGEEMIAECVVPSLEKMSGSFQETGNPYGDVISALLVFLREIFPNAHTQALSLGERALSSGGITHA